MPETLALGKPSDPADIALPALREDLTLLEAPRAHDGAPCWNVHDPVRNRFFRIGWLEFELLARWRGGISAGALCRSVARETALEPEPEDALGLMDFLQANELLRAADSALRANLQAMASARALSAWQWLLHHYLFIRVPLFKPEAFLARTQHLVEPLFRPAFFGWLAAMALFGLWRVLDQWSAFSQTFLYFFSWQGALYYGLALTLAKLLHELAHAYTARHYGLRVPTMGIALMMLWPLLYTDTSEAWKLHSRRARLAIGAAGVVAELLLAGVAALVWSLAPDGAVKSGAYILAAVTWVSTLAINLNPFMRFDGYYLLMDALDIPNLSERAFAIGRWQLRRSVLGIEAPMPEGQLEPRRRVLTLYAYATWAYRLVMFTGIAAAVYFFFFKLAGIILFAVEIGWFVVRPLWREGRTWWRLRSAWRARAGRNALALLALLVLLAVPWHGEVSADGYWQAGQHSRLFAPMPARLAQILVHEGQAVRAGTPLIVFEAPEVRSQLRLLASRITGLEEQLAGSIGSATLNERARVIEHELDAARAERQFQTDELARLTVRAPHDGVVRDLDRGLYPGVWIGPRHAIGLLVNTASSQASIFVREADIGRIQIGARARLLLRRADTRAVLATVTGIDDMSSRLLPEPMLASTHGGPIATRAGQHGELIANEALYRVTLRVDEPDARAMQPVSAHVEGASRSLLWDFGRQAIGVMIRESGF